MDQIARFSRRLSLGRTLSREFDRRTLKLKSVRFAEDETGNLKLEVHKYDAPNDKEKVDVYDLRSDETILREQWRSIKSGCIEGTADFKACVGFLYLQIDPSSKRRVSKGKQLSEDTKTPKGSPKYTDEEASRKIARSNFRGLETLYCAEIQHYRKLCIKKILDAQKTNNMSWVSSILSARSKTVAYKLAEGDAKVACKKTKSTDAC